MVQHNRKILAIDIFKLCFASFSLLIVTSCAPTGNNADALSGGENITENDIQLACEEIENKGLSILDTKLLDLNFDGTDELLILTSWGRNEIYVFSKSSGEMYEESSFGMGKLDYVSSLELYPYTADNEEYYCFSFHFDNGGVMSCDVLAAIKCDETRYSVEYLLSWGTLDYSDLPEPIVKEFYREGWNQTDIALDADYNDLSREEFMALYEKYTEAPT